MAWIPSKDAGANTQYDGQRCNTSTWFQIGTINQQHANGWTLVGIVSLDPGPMCAIREHNFGPGTWDLAEDALQISQQ
jgi:hypothetical protein